MKDPVRLLEEGDALEVRVLRSAAGDAAPTRVRDRVLAVAVASAVTTSAAAASGATAAGVKGSGVVGAVGVAKWVSIVVVAGVATAGTVRYVAERGGEGAQGAATVAPVTTVTTRAAVAPMTKALPVPVVPAATATSAPSATTAVPRSATAASSQPAHATSLLEELALLDAARAALDSGDTALATEKLDRHDLDYAHGQLAPDALALRIEVYAKRQDDARVRELGGVFLARYPEHPQAPRVRGIMARAGGGMNP
jgi:hypothetical protein